MSTEDDHEKRIAKLEARLETFATKKSLSQAENRSLTTEVEIREKVLRRITIFIVYIIYAIIIIMLEQTENLPSIPDSVISALNSFISLFDPIHYFIFGR